ncbi:MAG: type II toxin-antitoxin system VapC family toxin [Planctomycetaceae bacterium]|nr:type II toxin-antitoxin system VapC family toxin [Planctomycetaceae bacterium]
MKVLVDTNILLRSTEAGHSQHLPSADALDVLEKRGHELVIVPQILYEYWSVATRPLENNGLGMSPADVHERLIDFLELYRLLRDERAIFAIWVQLEARLAVKGKPTHDALLVAAMIRHTITHLLTYNITDFKRFSEVTALSPQIVLEDAKVI